MGFETSVSFNLLDFHDSVISDIDVVDDQIMIGLEFANILPEHEANPYATAKSIGPCVLVFIGVAYSIPKVFNDAAKEYEVHPDQRCPLAHDIVEADEIEPQNSKLRFLLCGMHKSGWTNWYIDCEGFKLTWEAFGKDSWYAN